MIAALVAAAAVAVTPVQYVEAQQRADGCFGDAAITAWAALGLRAAGAPTGNAAGCLAAHEDEVAPELALLAEAALGHESPQLVAKVRARLADATPNATAWSVLALRQAGEPVPRAAVTSLLRAQSGAGGWSWATHGAPDSNDTAAVVEALAAAGVRGKPVARALGYLRRLRNADGGYELTSGRGSDVQSTAWVVQAFLAARADPGRGAFAYLARMRRTDGSLRYSARYATTPLWVTAQALPALARRPFPLR